MTLYDGMRTRLFELYYAYLRVLNRCLPSIRLDGKEIRVRPGVYKPLEHEQRMADYCEPGSRVLDLGCGSGVATVFAAPRASEVVAVDINPGALENTRENCRAHGISNAVVLQSDMFASVSGSFDLIIAHPPYIHLDVKGVASQFATSVWFLEVLFREATKYLAEGGRLVVLFPGSQQERLEELATAGGLRLVDCRDTERKGPKLMLTSLLYLQIGFRTRRYLFERMEPQA